MDREMWEVLQSKLYKENDNKPKLKKKQPPSWLVSIGEFMIWDCEKLKRDNAKAHANKDIPPKKKKKLPGWLVSTMIYGGYVIGAIILIALLWIPGRWISYKTKYESQVKKAIIEMVKPEALKEKYRVKISDGQPQSLKE